MKKLMSMLLILAMLLPMGIYARAETAQPAQSKPFYMVNWGGSETQYPNVYDLPFFWAYSMEPGATEGKISWNDESDVPTLAKNLKEKFDAQPEGTRYINYCLAATAVGSQAEHVIYHDNAVKIMKKWLDEFLAEYKRIGGLLDGVIIDVEYIESHAWYLQDYYTGGRGKTVNTNIFADIVNDPRYKTDVRPLLEELGFEFYAEASGEKSEIWTIYRNGGAYSAISYSVWNHVMDYMERIAYREGVLETLLEYYPDAGMSDYQSGAHATWENSRDVSGGALPFNLISAGNVANCNAYVGRNWGATAPMPGYNKAIHEQNAFAVTQNDVNLFKEILNSTPDGRIDAWLGNFEYNLVDEGDKIVTRGDRPTYSGTPYYSEVIFHIGLLNPEVFLGFLIHSKIIRDGFVVDESIKVTSDILVELSRVAGFSDRKALEGKANWNGDYLLTGMYAGGRNIWRITPDTTKVSVEDFKIKDKAPTFRVGNLTITFPQGRIIEDGEVSRAGTCGYWVETPANVKPVVTADNNRYVNDPSLWAHFEEYAADTAFTNNSALPEGTWAVEGTVMVEKGNNGNALALYNGGKVTCKTLPQLITAGDDYAKEQGWDVSVTLPADYTGTMILLKAADEDRGFKIEGSKLYYDENGAYKEFPNVSLGEGTYILRRQMDFRKENAFTCNYMVFDGSGNLLGEVKDVPVKNFALPVAEVSMAASSFNKPVLVDDFCMYPMGTTTLLELYETEWGKKLDVAEARTEETAYRMSWMNTTNSYKVAYIYDAATREVIRKVEMAPGMDGVVTGIYKPEGEAVTFAVEVHAVAAPETPDYDSGSFDWKPYEIAYEEPKADPIVGQTIPDPTDPDNPDNPNGTPQNPGAQAKLDTGLVVMLVLAGVALLGGGGFVAYSFAAKSQKRAKKKKQSKNKE